MFENISDLVIKFSKNLSKSVSTHTFILQVICSNFIILQHVEEDITYNNLKHTKHAQKLPI